MDALPFPFPLALEDIQHRRAMVLSALCSADGGFCVVPVRSVQSTTLKLALRLYDQLFFQGFLGQAYDEIAVTLSARLVSSAGKFLYMRGATRQRKAEIRMSGDFLFRLTDGPFCSTGCLSLPHRRPFWWCLSMNCATHSKMRSSARQAIPAAF